MSSKQNKIHETAQKTTATLFRLNMLWLWFFVFICWVIIRWYFHFNYTGRQRMDRDNKNCTVENTESNHNWRVAWTFTFSPRKITYCFRLTARSFLFQFLFIADPIHGQLLWIKSAFLAFACQIRVDFNFGFLDGHSDWLFWNESTTNFRGLTQWKYNPHAQIDGLFLVVFRAVSASIRYRIYH